MGYEFLGSILDCEACVHTYGKLEISHTVFMEATISEWEEYDQKSS